MPSWPQPGFFDAYYRPLPSADPGPGSVDEADLVQGLLDKINSGASDAELADAISALLGGAPSNLDTLGELAAAVLLRAPIASPAFTGNPTAPTPLSNDSSQTIATTAFVDGKTSAIVGSPAPPATLDTIQKLALALGNDPGFAAAMASALAAKLDRTGGTMTGPLVLASDPVQVLEAATRQYVDTKVTAVLDQASYVKATKALLDAFLTPVAGSRAEVTSDPTPALNGIYEKVGGTGTGSWTQLSQNGTTSVSNRLGVIEAAKVVERLPGVERAATTAVAELSTADPGVLYAVATDADEMLFHVDDRKRLRHPGERDVSIATIEAGKAVIYSPTIGRRQIDGAPAPLAVQGLFFDRALVLEDRPLYTSKRPMIYGAKAGPPVPAGLIHMHVHMLGQSLHAGSNGIAPYFQVPDHLLPNNCLMLERVDGHQDVRGGLSGTSLVEALTVNQFRGFTRLVEGAASSGSYGQTTAAGFAAAAQADALASVGIPYDISLFSSAVGGTEYNDRKKGTQPYTNALVAAQVARDTIRAAGGQILYPAVLNADGESDVGAVVFPRYYDKMVEYHGDLNADFKALSAQAADLIMILNQQSSFATAFNNGSHVQQEELMRTLPQLFRVACPNYFLHMRNFVDGVHHGSAEYFDLGAYLWEAFKQAVFGDGSWRPVSPINTRRVTNSQIEIPMNVPAGTSLVFDTTTFSDPNGSYGFRLWSPSLSTVPISSVSIVGNSIVIDTTAPMPSGVQVWYALAGHPIVSGTPNRTIATVPRGNLRNNTTRKSLRDGTTPLYDWCLHFNLNVPDVIS